MTTHHLQHIRTWAAGINGVFCWLQAIEVELAIGIGAELAPQVVPGLVLWVKNIVFAIGAGLPHVEDSVWNANSSINILDRSVEVGQLSVFGHILYTGSTELTERSLRRPERTEDRGGGWDAALRGDNFVVNFIDETIGFVSVRNSDDVKEWQGAYDSIPKISHNLQTSFRLDR